MKTPQHTNMSDAADSDMFTLKTIQTSTPLIRSTSYESNPKPKPSSLKSNSFRFRLKTTSFKPFRPSSSTSTSPPRDLHSSAMSLPSPTESTESTKSTEPIVTSSLPIPLSSPSENRHDKVQQLHGNAPSWVAQNNHCAFAKVNSNKRIEPLAFQRISAKAIGIENTSLCPKSEWVLNKCRNTCIICSQNFKLWKRRHHCRMCGEMVCKLCCMKVAFDKRGIRTCMECIYRRLPENSTQDSSPSTLTATTDPTSTLSNLHGTLHKIKTSPTQNVLCQIQVHSDGFWVLFGIALSLLYGCYYILNYNPLIDFGGAFLLYYKRDVWFPYQFAITYFNQFSPI